MAIRAISSTIFISRCLPVVTCTRRQTVTIFEAAEDKMLLTFVPLVIVTCSFFSTVLCGGRFDWSIGNDGKTRLRGNSFGSGYVNTTYDYVVSLKWE